MVDRDVKYEGREHNRFALITRGGNSRSPKECLQCKKFGHIVDFCWDFHPERKT